MTERHAWIAYATGALLTERGFLASLGMTVLLCLAWQVLRAVTRSPKSRARLDMTRGVVGPLEISGALVFSHGVVAERLRDQWVLSAKNRVTGGADRTGPG
jgi:hypothetical protein